MILNELNFAGFAGRDAEDKTTPSGTRIVSFSLCHTQKGKDGQADKQTWVNVKAFSWSADTAARVKKGSNVFVKGPLSVEEYVSKTGEKKTMVSMIANQIAICEKDQYKQTSGTAPLPQIPLSDPFYTTDPGSVPAYLQDIPF